MWEKAFDIMMKNPPYVYQDVNIKEVAKHLLKHNIECLPVVDKDKLLLGVITKTSLCNLIAKGAGNIDGLKVSECIQENFNTVREEKSANELLGWKEEFIVVIDSIGLLKGIITRDNLVQTFIKSTKTTLAKLQTIIDSTYNGFIAINTINQIILINKAAAKFIGCTCEEALGRQIEQVIPSTSLPKVIKTGKSISGEKIFINGYTCVTNRSPIYEGNKLIGAVAVFQDISALESIAQQLEMQNNLNKELDAIIDSCHDAIVVSDSRGKLEKINKAYERISGIDRNTILGRHMTELEEEGIVSKSISLLVLKKKKPVTIIQKINTGREIIFTGTPVLDDDNNIVKVVSTGRDLTELNNLKYELERTKEMSNKYYLELQQLKKQLAKENNIIRSSAKMKRVFDLAIKVAKVDSTVLIMGESGAGKEVVARFIHCSSNRKQQPFITINCGAIPDSLLESELFGYEDGAFTGACKGGKAGLFEQANGGTVFLDEIGELPLNLQVKLLRVLQEQEISRIGGGKPKQINIKIIAATNADLAEQVKKGVFRKDLFYRLNVVPITVPPLREREEDIVPLTYHFLKKHNSKYSFNKRIAPEVTNQILNYHWPGNVRELENHIERMVVTSGEDTIELVDLPQNIKENCGNSNLINIDEIMPLKEAVRQVEQLLIDKALQKYGSTRKAAKVLGVNQSTIVRKKNMD